MNSQIEKPESKEENKKEISLWDLISFLSGATAFGGAFAVAKNSHLRTYEYLVTLVVGLAISVACILVIRAIGGWSLGYLSQVDVERQGIFRWKDFAGRCVYLFAFMWLIISSLLSNIITNLFVNWCL